MIGEHLKGSEARLWQLIDQRRQPDADRDAIDARIWDLFGADWAVMFTDLAGFSRNVAAFGITHFLQVILEHKQLLLPIVAAHDGIVVKADADSFLILIRRAETAVRAAVAMQRACVAHNACRAPEEQVLLCVGIGYGPVLRVNDSNVYGHEVNLASKLGEDTARAGDILLTPAAYAAAGQVAETTCAPVSGAICHYRLVYAAD